MPFWRSGAIFSLESLRSQSRPDTRIRFAPAAEKVRWRFHRLRSLWGAK
eukprot:COSAG04_NODE_29390_length_269_cov_0.723529_1_plen_48_part_10